MLSDGTKQLTIWKTLAGHTRPVLQTAWNPHRDGLLLTSSQDSTVRVCRNSRSDTITLWDINNVLSVSS